MPDRSTAVVVVARAAHPAYLVAACSFNLQGPKKTPTSSDHRFVGTCRLRLAPHGPSGAERPLVGWISVLGGFQSGLGVEDDDSLPMRSSMGGRDLAHRDAGPANPTELAKVVRAQLS